MKKKTKNSKPIIMKKKEKNSNLTDIHENSLLVKLIYRC